MNLNDYILKRGLPDCPESELQVLAVMIEEPLTALEILTENSIDADYFYSPVNQHLYDDITKMIDEGYKLDINALVDCLKKRKHSIDMIKTIVPDLFESFAPASHLMYHIKNLKLFHRKREAVQAGVELIEKGYNGSLLEDFTGEKKNLVDEIRKYIINTTGEFNILDLDRELQLTTKENKKQRTVILCRLAKEEVIEKIGKRTGTYRMIIRDENIIDWENANFKNAYDLKLIFGIDKLINIFPKNIIIIAGEKDAGKTAFLLNIVRDNMLNYKIYYFSSEMVEMELKCRLEKFKDIDKWDFTPIERSGNFQDIIRPDDINIIDFLEISDNFFRIAEDIRKIYDKLNKGIAIIAIQKKAGTDYGRGAEFSMEKARLYLSLQAGSSEQPSQLKIVSAKNWTDEHNNPRGKIYDYKLYQGCEFTQTNLITNPYQHERQYKG